ncbi:MAG TPA: enoyl-CoA hydratase/isomerase family protein [Thermoanaerobaculia bacterium]|nr:enoyl-CoA hydratase/isomerase family protein [Thermoanaerobaculia bacterium]
MTVARVVLSSPILDEALLSTLDAHFAALENRRDLHAIVLEAEGPHFSYGASIEEHLPESIESSLAHLHALLRRVAAAPAPTIAAVRGYCLGGGLELALACDLIVAAEDAQFGLPEIKLGVFPPAASALLPVRLGVAGASTLILTGTSWSAAEAFHHGLVARISAVDDFLNEHFLPRTATALRYAARAVRRNVVRALNEDLPQLERLYLEELMREDDAVDGIRAFLQRR